jgi:hypothetical protein
VCVCVCVCVCARASLHSQRALLMSRGGPTVTSPVTNSHNVNPACRHDTAGGPAGRMLDQVGAPYLLHTGEATRCV